MHMGTKLLKTHLDAKLPGAPAPCRGARRGRGDWPGYEYVVETFRSLLPALERLTQLEPAQLVWARCGGSEIWSQAPDTERLGRPRIPSGPSVQLPIWGHAVDHPLSAHLSVLP